MLSFYWVHQKIKNCPCDGKALVTTAVPVKRLDGIQKKIHMLVCTECDRKFLVKHTLSNTINLAEYCLKEHELTALPEANSAPPRKTATQSITTLKKPLNKELLYSNQYGEGEVIGRVKDKQGTKITIRFADCEKVFYEEMAFTKGGLKRVK